VVLAHSRSGSIGTNTVLSNNDRVGDLLFRGADGTNYIDAASISAQVDGTPGTNDMPGRLVFSTTADGASSPTERMRIDSTGAVIVGDGTTWSKYVSDAVFQITHNTNPKLVLNNPGDATFSLGVGTDDDLVIRNESTSSDVARFDYDGRLFVGLNSTPVSASLSTLTGGNSSTYAYMFVAGGSISNYKMLKAGGKFIVRGTVERNIDLVQAVQADGNMNILITVKFKLNSATSGESGEIYCQADMHATGSGNWNYGVKTPQKTQHFGTSYGVGSLAWVGSGTNDKILRYSTDSNSAYTSYMIEEIVITGYDNANTTLL